MRLGFAVMLQLGALMLGVTARAQQEPAKGARPNFVEALARLDANGDKVIEQSEVPESGRAAFDRLLKRGDSNKDGKLDREELGAMLSRVRELGDAARPRLKAMDKDGDGKISKAEFTGQEAMFDRLDANKDGVIGEDEFPKPPIAPTPAIGRGLMAMDENKDGKVSKAEFTGPEPLFTRLDANKDGFIAKDEIPGAGEKRKIDPKPEPAKAAPRGQFLMRLDKDGDGKISKSEFVGREQVFNRLDKNSDGFISKDELPDPAALKNALKKKAAKPAKP